MFPPSPPPVVTSTKQGMKTLKFPPPPAPSVGPLSFDHLPPFPSPAVSRAAAATRVQAPEIHSDALKYLRASHPEVVGQDELRIIRQLQQLMPLQLNTVMDWGAKTMDRLRQDSALAAAVIKAFTQARGTELIEAAVLACTAVPKKTGFFDRFKGDPQTPTSLEPQLTVLRSQLGPWMIECDQRISTAKVQHRDILTKFATLVSVANTIGTISDNTLDMAVNNRRTVLQQGSMQAALVIQQLEDVRTLIINQRMQLDQVLDVTLPAYKTAASRC